MAAGGAARPDLILVMTDQQRHDQVGYRRATPVRTPTLDGLAAAGVTFTSAYSASTTCIPARTSLLTGMLDHRLPRDENTFLREGTPTVPRTLRDAGYQTALVGKAHFHPLHADHGFDHLRLCEHLNAYPGAIDPDGPLDDYHDWLDAQGLADHRLGATGADAPALETHPTSWVRDEALAVLRERDPARPLHLVISFPHPHPPIDPPSPYAEMYAPGDCEIDPDAAAANRFLPHVFRQQTTQADHPQRRVDPARLAEHQADLARTYGLITQVDDALADIVEQIDLTRSLLVFTSDHGDFAGRRGLVRKVPWIPFDDLARVPFFATGAGVAGGRTIDAPVQSFDLAPTFLDAAGLLDGSSGLDGASLGPTLSDPDATGPADRLVFSAISMGWPMVRRGPHKYIRSRGWGAEVLFDVERDPDEVVNLTSLPEAAPVVAELSRAVDSQLAAERPRDGAPRAP